MKINFNSNMLNFDGKALKEKVEGEEKEILLKNICVNALLYNVPDARPEKGTEKITKYELAKRINVGGEVEVTAEEISLMKEQITKLYSTLIVGVSYDLLENGKQE